MIKNIKWLFFPLMLSLVLSASAMAKAGVAVVVHPDNTNKLDEAEVRRIFLGKARSYPDGSDAIPVEQAMGSEARAEFLSKVLKKSEGQLNAYWARMLFSSKAMPPRVARDSDEIKQMIAQNPRSIGYIDASKVDKTVKVLVLIP